MQPLRIRRSDAAPGLSRDQYFGRLGESELGDQDLSSEAKVFLLAVRLWMSMNHNPTVCLATNDELAQLCGRTGTRRTRERWACRWLRALIDRGHVEVEQIRTIANSPRGIRPLGRLRGRSTQTKVSGCDPTESSARHDTVDAAPRQNCRVAPTVPTVPLKREGPKDKTPKKVPATSAATGKGSPPPPSLEGGEADGPRSMAELMAQIRAKHPELGRTPARKRAPGSSAKIPPGLEGPNRPDQQDGRTEGRGSSTPDPLLE